MDQPLALPAGAHSAYSPASSQETAPALPLLQPIPLRELAPWLLFGGVLMLMLVYFVGVEQGALSLISNSYVHELVHDGRHLLAFPCH